MTTLTLHKEPKIQTWAIPHGTLAVNFYDTAVDVSVRIEPSYGPRPMTVIETDDGTRIFVFDREVKSVKREVKQIMAKHMADTLLVLDEWLEHHRHSGGVTAPAEIEWVRQEIFSQDAVEFSLTWWEVSW